MHNLRWCAAQCAHLNEVIVLRKDDEAFALREFPKISIRLRAHQNMLDVLRSGKVGIEPGHQLVG